MEQITSIETSSEQQSDSPPSKRAKRQSNDESATTSSDATITAVNLNGSNPESNQHSTNTDITDNQQPSKNSIYNFVFPSEDDSVGSPGENLGPTSAGLKSSRAGGVWNKSREEAHSAQVKEKSLLGHIIGLEGTQQKISESDLFRILESEGVTEIGALYKVSPSKFVLVFGSKAAREKLENTEIQCRLGDLDICLNFHKRMGPFRNGREPIFVTILLPEFISDQAVRLAFSEFGEVISVFKGRHKFNTDIRNGKRHVKIFPAGGDPGTLPRKISFYGRVRRDVLFAEKVVLCYRCKTRHMLGESCPVVAPTSEDFDMSNIEQSEPPRDKLTPEKPDSSVVSQSSTETRGGLSTIEEKTGEDDSSTEESGTGSDSGSTSEPSDEDDSELVSSVPETPLRKPASSSSRKNLVVTQKAQVNPESTSANSPPPKKEMESLRRFNLDTIFKKWYSGRYEYEGNIFRLTIEDMGLKGDFDLEQLVKLLKVAAELIDFNQNSMPSTAMFKSHLNSAYQAYFIDTPVDKRPTVEAFDNHMCCWARKIWPRALDIIKERIRLASHEYTRSRSDKLGFY